MWWSLRANSLSTGDRRVCFSGTVVCYFLELVSGVCKVASLVPPPCLPIWGMGESHKQGKIGGNPALCFSISMLTWRLSELYKSYSEVISNDPTHPRLILNIKIVGPLCSW